MKVNFDKQPQPSSNISDLNTPKAVLYVEDITYNAYKDSADVWKLSVCPTCLEYPTYGLAFCPYCKQALTYPI